MKRFIAYSFVGGIGFAVDAGVLTYLVSTNIVNPYVARCLSFPPAVFVTWLLNRSLVFSSSAISTSARANEYGRYFSLQAIGAFINLSVYSFIIASIPQLGQWPVIPLAVGSGTALAFNFIGAKRWIFTP